MITRTGTGLYSLTRHGKRIGVFGDKDMAQLVARLLDEHEEAQRAIDPNPTVPDVEPCPECGDSTTADSHNLGYCPNTVTA